MTEKHVNYQPDQNPGLTRREVLRMAELVLDAAALLWLASFTPWDPTEISATPTTEPTSSPEEIPTRTPTSTAIETKQPTQTPGSTAKPTQIESSSTPTTSPELRYAEAFPKETNLGFTIGNIDLRKPFSLVIHADSNLYTGQEVTIDIPKPLAFLTEKSWQEARPLRDEFNQWNRKEEQALTVLGRPSTHPFTFLHSNINKIFDPDTQRIFAGEYFQKAYESVINGEENPLIGKPISLLQEIDGKLHRATLRIVDQAFITKDDLAKLFRVDSQNPLFVDFPLTGDITKLSPEHQGPQHYTIATCNQPLGEGQAAFDTVITTMELDSVEEITHPFTLFMESIRHGFTQRA